MSWLRARRIVPGIPGLLCVVFGAACLSYVKPATLEHHRAWAAERGMPGPSNAVLYLGALALTVGAVTVTAAVVRR